MNFFHFLVSKVFIKQILFALGILALLLIVTFQGLKLYTYHGKYIQVPDLEGLKEDQIMDQLESKSLRYEIIDSVYSKRHEPGVVVEHLPKPGAKVKKNRKLFVIINAKSPEMVLMPNLSDVSIRQAKNILESSGLKTGDIIYVNSPYPNLVLNQYFDHKPIEAGARILKNSIIDLEVGKGLGNEKGNIPDLTGLRITEAKEALSEASLNLGVIIDDVSSKEYPDSAFVWKQRPLPEDGAVQLGIPVDIWLTLDSALLLPDSTLFVPIVEDEMPEEDESDTENGLF